MIRLIYSSVVSQQVTAEELGSILGKARSNNRLAAITGILVYHRGNFLQVLEGDDSAVEKLFAKITSDRRHSDVVLLDRSSIERRSFHNWQMGFVNTEHLDVDLPTGLTEIVSQNGAALAFDREQARELIDWFRATLAASKQPIESREPIAV